MRGNENTTYAGAAIDTVTLPFFAAAATDLGSSEILESIANGVQGNPTSLTTENLVPMYVDIQNVGGNLRVVVQPGQLVIGVISGVTQIIGTARNTGVNPFFTGTVAKSAIGPAAGQTLEDSFAGVRLVYGGASSPTSVDLLDTRGNVIATGTSSNTGAAPSRSFLTTRLYKVGQSDNHQVAIYH